MWLVSMSGSVLVDWIISRRLMRTTVIRKVSNTLATLGPGLALLGAAYSGANPPLSMSLLTLAVGLSGFIYSGVLSH